MFITSRQGKCIGCGCFHPHTLASFDEECSFDNERRQMLLRVREYEDERDRRRAADASPPTAG